MPVHVFEKARMILKQEGLPPFFFRLTKKVGSVCFDSNVTIWFENDLRNIDNRLKDTSQTEGFDVIFHDHERVVEWMKIHADKYPWMYHEKEIQFALQSGHLIPFLAHNDRIIGYTKVALNKVYIRDYNMIFSLAPNKGMFYDTTLLTEYRGKRLPAYLKKEIFHYLRRINIDYLYAHIEPWNVPSIKSNESLGFHSIGANKFYRIFFIKIHSNNPSKILS